MNSLSKNNSGLSNIALLFNMFSACFRKLSNLIYENSL